MKITLFNERPISLNAWYSGRHWSKRAEEARRVHALVCYEALCYRSYTERVDIHITAYYQSRPADPDNICSKLYIDGLVYAGVLANDTREYVRRVTVQSEIDRENPRVEIEITEAK